MELLYLLLVIILIDLFHTYKEGFSEENLLTMKDSVSKFPSTFSVDPFYLSVFKPECCPNQYSSSSGCLCVGVDEYSMLYSRGGNSYGFQYAS